MYHQHNCEKIVKIDCISGLDRRVLYLVQVSAINGAGEGNKTEEVMLMFNSALDGNDFPHNVRITSPSGGADIRDTVTVQWDTVKPSRKQKAKVVRLLPVSVLVARLPTFI